MLPVTIDRGDDADQPEQRGLLRREHGDDAGGLGVERLKYGPATGLALPTTWAILSAQPAYQTSRSIGRVDGLLGPGGGEALGPAHRVDELRAPVLHDLGDPVEDLARL